MRGTPTALRGTGSGWRRFATGGRSYSGRRTTCSSTARRGGSRGSILRSLAGGKALESRQRVGEAGEDYRRVADNFASLAELFPFRPDLPRGEKAGADAAKEAVELLERALFWERSAVSKLEQALKDNITR